MPRSGTATVLASGLRRLHRWLGLFAAAFALLLAITGLLLNHADALQLDRHRFQADWLLQLYGVEPPPLIAVRQAREHWISLWGQQLFVDAEPLRGMSGSALLAAFTGPVDRSGAGDRLGGTAAVEAIGGVKGAKAAERGGEADEADRSGAGLLYVVTDRQLLLLTLAGEPVDALLLPDAGRAVAARRHAERIVIATDAGRRWSTDLEASAWRAEAALGPEATPGPEATSGPETTPGSDADTVHSAPGLPAALDVRIRQWWRGEGISALQLIRDLHSGSLAHALGRLLLDLAALALVGLALSGLWLALRPRRVRSAGKGSRTRPRDAAAVARPTTRR